MVDPAWIRAIACTCGPAPELCIPDDEVVSHYGGLNPEGICVHKNTPDPTSWSGLSMIRGFVEPEEACRVVLGGRARSGKLRRACARYAYAGALRAAGLSVVHAPTRGNDDHATVVFPRVRPLQYHVNPWPHQVSRAFDGCFNGCRGTTREEE